MRCSLSAFPHRRWRPHPCLALDTRVPWTPNPRHRPKPRRGPDRRDWVKTVPSLCPVPHRAVDWRPKGPTECPRPVAEAQDRHLRASFSIVTLSACVALGRLPPPNYSPLSLAFPFFTSHDLHALYDSLRSPSQLLGSTPVHSFETFHFRRAHSHSLSLTSAPSAKQTSAKETTLSIGLHRRANPPTAPTASAPLFEQKNP
jgi:hypothetical protein